ncbi:MAG: hypothetical protein K1X68_01845 [Saprospiraceae bacterium]|nr:hypothetical protein [Saprospiraceae bacterium]HMW38702.1 hypothetical protein [Saprospiraceae bacterium]HMX87931.1 hypothetical protein [Saprospiraceae bacterium]HMZ40018.1 hypothetical protein [Saprospiraceae bacterium]HNA64408.1 hypothetical protein [Saprospiraceae bacterium]
MNRLIQVMLIVITLSQTAFCQLQNKWLGGYPGKVNEWSCPYNWSLRHVPGSFDDVCIRGTESSLFKRPVIRQGTKAEVHSVSITEDHRLIIEEDACLRIISKAAMLPSLSRIIARGTLELPKVLSPDELVAP